MSALADLGLDLRVAVFGASGGIGSALCRAVAHAPSVASVYAGARRRAQMQHPKVTPFTFDLLDEASMARSAAKIGADGPLDLVIVATGFLHDDAFQPEKTWRDFSAEVFARAFALNATGPALIAKHMLPLLAPDRRSVFAAISARVGSIEDNRLGGWAAYRASKAALNQIVRTCAVELARKNKHAVCVALHPGTVDTALSAPFQRGVSPTKLFTPDESAAHLLGVIARLTPAQSGSFFAWDGAPIPF
jgi:NAD(P)-dependent dehydrogenase (short-subunit alcohol dehydrogenase family)